MKLRKRTKNKATFTGYEDTYNGIAYVTYIRKGPFMCVCQEYKRNQHDGQFHKHGNQTCYGLGFVKAIASML